MSDSDVRFSISFSKGPKYEPFRGSFEDGERHCLERLEVTGSIDALHYLIDHYRLHRREDLTRRKLQELIDATDDLEARAIGYVYLGMSYERTSEWRAAIDSFRGALSLEPCVSWTSYFTHSRLGRCLFKIGQFAEAERHCRLAISLDPVRPDAHQVLGLSLNGQGDNAGAARAWVDATRANAADSRSLKLLEQLIKERPQLLDELPQLRIQLDECRRAVALAREMYEEVQRPKDRPDGASGCRACGAKGVEIEAFGAPIDEDGRRLAVMICPGCGKQSLAFLLESEPETGDDVEFEPETPPSDPEPPEPPRLGPVFQDLFWLSVLLLAIAWASGLPGLVFSRSEPQLTGGNVWLMGLLTTIALAATTTLPSVRDAVRRVRSAFRWWGRTWRRRAHCHLRIR